MINEKQRIAGISVISAIFLTGSELIIGIVTGSLGLLSIALYSGLNLVTGIITFFLIQISDNPPDKEHNFGHGKIDTLISFLMTILQFITCIWIIYQALHRLIMGNTNFEISAWSYIVAIASIIVVFFHSRALNRVPKMFNSQALAAIALHYSTAIWSSLVILLGLIFTDFGLFFADSVAALIVSFIVIIVTYNLFKRSIEVLLDFPPLEKLLIIEEVLNSSHEIKTYHSLKVRRVGAKTFVSVMVALNPQLKLNNAHEICNNIEREICKVVDQCDVFIHTEPLTQKK